jgi:hypothetical protein
MRRSDAMDLLVSDGYEAIAAKLTLSIETETRRVLRSPASFAALP